MCITSAAESVITAAAATTWQAVMREIAATRDGHRTGCAALCSFTGALG